MASDSHILGISERAVAAGRLGHPGRASVDFSFSDRWVEYLTALLSFMDEFVYPAESLYAEQTVEAITITILPCSRN